MWSQSASESDTQVLQAVNLLFNPYKVVQMPGHHQPQAFFAAGSPTDLKCVPVNLKIFVRHGKSSQEQTPSGLPQSHRAEVRDIIYYLLLFILSPIFSFDLFTAPFTHARTHTTTFLRQNLSCLRQHFTCVVAHNNSVPLETLQRANRSNLTRTQIGLLS